MLTRWIRVHVPASSRWLLLGATVVELAFSPFALRLPWLPSALVAPRLALLLPSITIAACVAVLYSGLEAFERPTRRRWRLWRWTWCVAVGSVALLPGLLVAMVHPADPDLIPGELGNRLILFSIAAAASVVVSAGISVVPGLLWTMTAMMAYSPDAPWWTGPFLLRPETGALGVGAIGLVAAATLYAVVHPTAARVRAGAET